MKKGIFKIKNLFIFIILIMTSVFLIGCAEISLEEGKEENVVADSTEKLMVHFIDVGQADSILIEQGNSTMLIDAGNNDDGKIIKDYLSKRNITKIDYLVGTHPHEDHIGAMDDVIYEFEIGKIFMPKKTSTTKTYRDVVTAANKKSLKFTAPKVGDSFKLGEATFTILAPIKDYEDANDSSIVLKMKYGNNTFLFTGDAEGPSEQDILNSKSDLTADVLKLGHHGSRTSSSDKFLDAVNPKYGVITCEKNNDYGHPHIETVKKMSERNIKLYRTDEQGTIVANSDGKKITFNKSVASYKEGVRKNKEANNIQAKNEDNKSTTNKSNNSSKVVYFTPKGKAYHYKKDCSSLSNSKNILEGSLKDAKDQGKNNPCEKCAS
ncbi:ComEC/Rec2 family competence protein [Clostridium sp. UBA6640]|uniref:ComEC/Rec2 family competence protein n=1 Tax=Clostridium sp. UBA6640 TaxID=1946370 RepID=UPI0025BB3E99|nr:ComEC/Rec2 family competence protein [Clostridium sp. UBA6640]